ncbi:MAG TPA: hypothetical protein VGS20_13000 [Candidatus Acidoferrales bacterium]|nr:hypothetical protein [Candidatus Acidoferrales bacterium]
MIKRLVVLALGIVLSAAVAAQAGTLKLRSGQQYSGTYLGGTRDEIQFEINGQVQVFKTADVAAIDFDSGSTAAAVPAPASSGVIGDNAAGQTSTVTVPQGTALMIRMIDSVDSSVNKPGDIFHASLEDDLRIGDVTVARKGADVYGKLMEVKSAGRVTGKSELALQLTGIRTLNGVIQPIVTGDYSQVGKSRTGQTVKHGLGGALIGAAIGAVAGGGSGAAKGAAIGGAAGTAVTAITRGQQVKVPSETLLQFQLAQPFMITVPQSSQ